ncbi:MAG: ERV1/ALR-related protein [Candidatus Paceibacterota bacterium]
MVNPKIWGRAGWIFLISTVADYPSNPGIDMQYNYNRYFLHLKWVLPCEICRDNYEEHFRKWPIDQYLKSRAALFRWIMIMYNEVQTSLNKKTKGPQELLYELFGQEEGERMMQRLVYEDPDANITVIKPFDPNIDQFGGNKSGDLSGSDPRKNTSNFVSDSDPRKNISNLSGQSILANASDNQSDNTNYSHSMTPFIFMLIFFLILAYFLFK